MSLKFSVSIITFNEEENIERCLMSIMDLTDDIVVVDSGSTDNTFKICEKYGVNFFVKEFVDYGSQKDYAASLTKYEFVLSIDADEILSEKLKKSLKNIEDVSGQNIAFSFNRLNYHCGKPIKHCGWYPDKKIRLWNKNFGNWRGSIHETIVFKEKPKVIHIHGDLLHFTYNSYIEHINKAVNFAVRASESDFKSGKKSGIFKVLFSFWTKFFSIYIFKAGFLDGFNGLFIAITSAYATFLKNILLLIKKKIVINKKILSL